MPPKRHRYPSTLRLRAGLDPGRGYPAPARGVLGRYQFLRVDGRSGGHKNRPIYTRKTSDGREFQLMWRINPGCPEECNCGGWTVFDPATDCICIQSHKSMSSSPTNLGMSWYVCYAAGSIGSDDDNDDENEVDVAKGWEKEDPQHRSNKWAIDPDMVCQVSSEESASEEEDELAVEEGEKEEEEEGGRALIVADKVRDKVCAGCGCRDSSSKHLSDCARCFSVSYCSRECQAAHWKGPGEPAPRKHKNRCAELARILAAIATPKDMPIVAATEQEIEYVSRLEDQVDARFNDEGPSDRRTAMVEFTDRVFAFLHICAARGMDYDIDLADGDLHFKIQRLVTNEDSPEQNTPTAGEDRGRDAILKLAPTIMFYPDDDVGETTVELSGAVEYSVRGECGLCCGFVPSTGRYVVAFSGGGTALPGGQYSVHPKYLKQIHPESVSSGSGGGSRSNDKAGASSGPLKSSPPPPLAQPTTNPSKEQCVVLVGLKAKPLLNGRVGMVRGFDIITDRFEVELLPLSSSSSSSSSSPDTRGRIMKIKAVNLKDAKRELGDNGTVPTAERAAVGDEGTSDTGQHQPDCSSNSRGGGESSTPSPKSILGGAAGGLRSARMLKQAIRAGQGDMLRAANPIMAASSDAQILQHAEQMEEIASDPKMLAQAQQHAQSMTPAKMEEWKRRATATVGAHFVAEPGGTGGGGAAAEAAEAAPTGGEAAPVMPSDPKQLKVARSGGAGGGGGGDKDEDEETAPQRLNLRTRRTCAFCREAKKGLKRCGGCEVARYCSPICAKAHWKQGHKEECGKARKQETAESGCRGNVVAEEPAESMNY